MKPRDEERLERALEDIEAIDDDRNNRDLSDEKRAEIIKTAAEQINKSKAEQANRNDRALSDIISKDEVEDFLRRHRIVV